MNLLVLGVSFWGGVTLVGAGNSLTAAPAATANLAQNLSNVHRVSRAQPSELQLLDVKTASLSNNIITVATAPDADPYQQETTVREFTMHHVVDSDTWHPFPKVLGFLGDVAIHFPHWKLFRLGQYDIYFQNGLHALMLAIVFILLSLLFIFLYKRDAKHAPHGLTNLLEVLVLFIRDDIAKKYLGEQEGNKFAPFFLTVFFMILSLNLMGLIPLFATATANVNITAAFATITLSMMMVLGLGHHGLAGFFKLFIPAGVPLVLRPFIFILEFIGLFIKPFALTIRLFANLLAGHIVIFSILGVIITFGLAGIPAVGLALFIYLLEILVAFLQAYIFTLLSAIFIGEMVHPAH